MYSSCFDVVIVEWCIKNKSETFWLVQGRPKSHCSWMFGARVCRHNEDDGDHYQQTHLHHLYWTTEAVDCWSSSNTIGRYPRSNARGDFWHYFSRWLWATITLKKVVWTDDRSIEFMGIFPDSGWVQCNRGLLTHRCVMSGFHPLTVDSPSNLMTQRFD